MTDFRHPVPPKRESSERRRALNASATKVTKQAKRLRPSLIPSSLTNELKDWKQLSEDDFDAKAHQMLTILERERIRREQFPPDDSYERARGKAGCKINYYPVRRTLHRYTDWQLCHFTIFWSREIQRLVKLRAQRRRRTNGISE